MKENPTLVVMYVLTPMEGNMVRLMRRCQLAKSTREAARALEEEGHDNPG